MMQIYKEFEFSVEFRCRNLDVLSNLPEAPGKVYGRSWKVLEAGGSWKVVPFAFQYLISREDFVLFTLRIHNYFWKDI
ncbi:MAG: hypothetical protein QOJ40_220 [Verrucomicrobiota bacterium]